MIKNAAEKLEAIKNTSSLEAAVNEENKSFLVTGKGEMKGVLDNGLLAPNGQSIIVGGSPGTKDVIPGIYNITLKAAPGVLYDFTIEIDGQCPKGKWDNNLTFTDRSGDTYSLRIFSESRTVHTVNYHSTDGAINKITWDI